MPVVIVVTLCVSPSFAEPLQASDKAAPASDKVGTTHAMLLEAQEYCRNEMRKVAATISRGEGKNADVRADPRIELWSRLELILSQRLSIAEQSESHESQREHWQTLLDRLRQLGPDEPRPYSFLLLEDERDKHQIELENGESIRRELLSERSLLAAARERFEREESLRRQKQEEVGSEANLGTERTAAELDLAELRSRVAKAELDHCRERVVHIQRRQAVSQSCAAYLESRIHHLVDGVQFSKEDLEEQLTRIKAGEDLVHVRLRAVKSKLQSLLTAGAGTTPADVESDDVHRRTCETTQQEVLLLQQILRELAVANEAWNRRYLLLNEKAADGNIPAWLDETQTAQDRLQHLSNQTQLRMRQMLREQIASSPSASANGDSTQAATTSASSVDNAQSAIDFYGETLVFIESVQRLHGRYVQELQSVMDRTSLASVLTNAKNGLFELWRFEIASVDDRSITIGKIFSGILLAILGFFLARFCSRLFGHRLLPRLGMDRRASTAIQSVVFYALIVCFSFGALRLVNVPLTIFAFLGGAVAIGFGFGSQNILNNFISGLILLVERPIRVDDLVNVDGFDATIERIGARSTRVRTGDNRDILVPNSKFLENNVTNWTLSDTRVRKHISVGVAYGSPVERVMKLIDESVRGNAAVLPSPAPIVLFRNFGESSLEFEAHFWVHMQTMMEGHIIESQIRQVIDASFREAEITIAFPQRDVHLNVPSPVALQLLPAESTESDKDATKASPPTDNALRDAA